MNVKEKNKEIEQNHRDGCLIEIIQFVVSEIIWGILMFIPRMIVRLFKNLL
ncbi:hypothetical protein [Solibacillus sp. CAU 1738]|uniref:hypothetical protein n=1 Tax=Solibacillus sp. CAU 1738 TaxID=3140363 RepID=UPI00326120D4